MLYLDFAINKEDFILDNEKNYPYLIQKMLLFWRKKFGQPIIYTLEGKNIVLISKFNRKISKKLDKIFKIDVTKTVCVCDFLRENQEFMNYLKEKDLKILDGKWLFPFLVCPIADLVCKKNNVISEEQEIVILINEPNFLVFETIQKLSQSYKNITVVTKKVRKFDKIVKEIHSENGLMLNVTNNFKNSCLKSKIIFNFDFDEKDIAKIRLLADSTIINLEHYVDVKQSNFKGENVDFYTINLPLKYHKIYKRLNNFNSSILYESLIYKKTANKNIWKEILDDKVQVLGLESREQNIFF